MSRDPSRGTVADNPDLDQEWRRGLLLVMASGIAENPEPRWGEVSRCPLQQRRIVVTGNTAD